ncbi:MAG: dienelactone hydrolase family protein [Methanomicrobiales archaeon]|nr:dienelactone hydrolase family protein [Methanomicrobiales archaeon]
MKPILIYLGFACLVFMIIAAGCTAGQQPQDTVTPVVTPAPVAGSFVNITAAGVSYPSFLAVPPAAGKHPAIVLIHSFNGLEQGYRDMVQQMARDGFVVIAPEWQTYVRQPPDNDVAAVIRGSLAHLSSRSEADMNRVGLTGFCAGGRYTMLYLPQMREFRSGVAWYGFPYNGAANDTIPAMHIAELQVPMLMIHGSRDTASPIRGIYNYSAELDAAGKYFELKVYQGKPHGFMITNGSLSRDDASMDAYREMIAFFRRTLM